MTNSLQQGAPLPWVSVVVPSYNSERYIKETLDSILMQDYPRLETIVVDGGSTDNTLEILRSYGKRIRWVSEKDNGQSDAINKGIGMSCGDIVAWLNADDLYEPGAVQAAVDYMATHPETAMIYGQVHNVTEENEIMERYYSEPFDLGRLTEALIIHQPGTFYRRGVFESVGMLEESLHYTMDLDLWIRIAQRYRIDYIENFIARFRIHSGSKTQAQRSKTQKQVLEVISRHIGAAPLTFENDFVRCRIFPAVPPWITGLFPDGWAFRRLKIGQLPAPLDRCRGFSFQCETRIQDLPLEIEAFAGKERLGGIVVRNDVRFEFSFTLPERLRGTHIELTTDHQHVPRDENPGQWDGRRLSYRVVKLTVKGEEGGHVCWDLVSARWQNLVTPLLTAVEHLRYSKEIPVRWLLAEYGRLLRRAMEIIGLDPF